MSRLGPFHGGNTSSNLVRDAKKNKGLSSGFGRASWACQTDAKRTLLNGSSQPVRATVQTPPSRRELRIRCVVRPGACADIVARAPRAHPFRALARRGNGHHVVPTLDLNPLIFHN